MIPPGATRVDDPAPLVAHYCEDRAVHIYALADLEPPFWEPSRWYQRGDAVVGIVSLPGGEGAAVYGVSTIDPEGALALLVDLLDELPPGQLITAPTGLAAAVTPHRGVAWSGPHLRYALRDRSCIGSRSAALVDLGPDDLEELQDLYAVEPGAAFFLPHMLGDDTFVGVRKGGELVAAGGTHVLSVDHGVAAIGGVYTRPEHRGEGLGSMVTSGVVHRLGGRVATIGLNVAEGNNTARRVYERLGFESIWRYEECELA